MHSWLVPLVLLAALVGLLVWRWKFKPSHPRLWCEYWVYVRRNQLPTTEAFLERMVGSNPFNKPGQPCIGAREGLLFTDLRFHMALARKEKNPESFRPDLADEHLALAPDTLLLLHDSTALVVLRYASDRAVADVRHLQFMPHAAAAILDLCDGTAVLDTQASQLWNRDEFKSILERRPQVDGFDLHCRVVWRQAEEGFRARTLGLTKVGRSDLVTDPQEPDHETLVTDVLRQAAREAFRDPSGTGPWTVEAFSDQFEVALGPVQGRLQSVRIGRRQPS